MKDEQRYQQGIEVRRSVLGDAHVDRTLSQLTPLNEEFQDFISRYAWGEIWTCLLYTSPSPRDRG